MVVLIVVSALVVVGIVVLSLTRNDDQLSAPIESLPDDLRRADDRRADPPVIDLGNTLG